MLNELAIATFVVGFNRTTHPFLGTSKSWHHVRFRGWIGAPSHQVSLFHDAIANNLWKEVVDDSFRAMDLVDQQFLGIPHLGLIIPKNKPKNPNQRKDRHGIKDISRHKRY